MGPRAPGDDAKPFPAAAGDAHFVLRNFFQKLSAQARAPDGDRPRHGVPDGGGAPGMDCLPLQQRAPGPFHYLISEQAKSLVALQELQNEVGALLEFRDLVMETFPHLQQKMVSAGRGGAGAASSSSASSSSALHSVGVSAPLHSGPAGGAPGPGHAHGGAPLSAGAGAAGAAAGGGGAARPWEPGQLRRKPHHARSSAHAHHSHGPGGAELPSVASLGRAGRKASGGGAAAGATQQPKSGEGSGTSSAGSSAVQDSGFGTETSSSSKEHHSGSGSASASTGAAGVGVGAGGAAGGLGLAKGLALAHCSSSSELPDEAEDELWNLLDVIQRKGTRLRDEVEHLQQRLQAGEAALGASPEERELRLAAAAKADAAAAAAAAAAGGAASPGAAAAAAADFKMADEDEVSGLRRERDFLLDKVAEMEAETLASRVRASQLQTELGSLVAAKRDLEEQLRVAVSQKSELNARIHDLHLQFVSGRAAAAAAAAAAANSAAAAAAATAAATNTTTAPGPLSHSSGASSSVASSSVSAASYSPLATELATRRLSLAPSGTRSSLPSPARGGGAAGGAGRARRASDSVASSAPAWGGRPRTPSAATPAPTPPPPPSPAPPLGALDGIVSSPHHLARGVPDARKVAAILREFNPVELQRHLLTTAVENKALQKELAKASRSTVHLVQQLDKVKDENDDLRFRLEEKNIELEGTRARVRVLERLQQKTAPPLEINMEPPMLPPDATTNPIIPLLALPMPVEENIHHSSSTESAHDHVVGPQSSETTDQGESKRETQQQTPKKRPSKIPLPGMKTHISPKPPSGKLAAAKRKDSPSGRGKLENSSLSGRNMRDASWKNRSDSVSSLGGKNRESPSGQRSSSLSARHNSRESLSGNKSRDSLSAKSRSDSLNSKKYNSDSMSSNRTRDATSQNSLSSNSSNKKDSISSKGKDAPYSSPGSRKGHHQMAARRVSNASINRSNLIDQSDQNSKVLTASDSLEPKLSSSMASNTNAELTDEVLDQPGDSFSDSLNNIPNQDVDCMPYKSSADTLPLTSSMYEQHSVYQASNGNSAQPFPWHSSSSEYFDSINNSESMFNNISLLRSCSYYQEQQFLQSTSGHEGLAECDSLENKETNVIEATKPTETYSVDARCASNVWIKFNKQSNEW